MKKNSRSWCWYHAIWSPKIERNFFPDFFSSNNQKKKKKEKNCNQNNGIFCLLLRYCWSIGGALRVVLELARFSRTSVLNDTETRWQNWVTTQAGTHEHFIGVFFNHWIQFLFTFVALAERILVDCHDIHVVVADFVVLESPPDACDDVEADVVADDQALKKTSINYFSEIF